MLICSIVRGVYEVRAQLEAVFSESTVFPEDIIIVVPWWWWPWMPLTDIHVPPTDIPVPPRHILPDPDLSRARASQMYRLITLQRRYWLLRQLIGSRNIMVLNSGRIMIHYAPPPLWIRFLLRITIIQKPRRWVQGDRGLLTSTVPVPKDLEKNEIAEASTYPEFERYELVAEASTDPNRNEDAEISIASDIAVAGDSIDLETNRPKPPQTFKRTGPYYMRTPQFW
jgi:hypothetical protein